MSYEPIKFKTAILRVIDTKAYLFLESERIMHDGYEIAIVNGEFYPEENLILGYKLNFGKIPDKNLSYKKYWYNMRDIIRDIYCIGSLNKHIWTGFRLKKKFPFIETFEEKYWIPNGSHPIKKDIDDFCFTCMKGCDIIVYRGIDSTNVKSL